MINHETGIKPRIIRPVEENESFTSNNTDPIISVISPSLNLAVFLEDTILSVARQTFKNFEHLIMDGGSTDNTKDIAERFPHVRFFSSKDSGPAEAIRKGAEMAKGKYILMPCISDGYINEEWFSLCVDILDKDPEVSLVWGFPQYLSEDGNLGHVSYPHFHHSIPPQKFDWFNYWLSDGFWLPEGNFCVRKNVFLECFLGYDNDKKIEPCLEFNYLFNTKGYLPYHIPVVSNFGRTHSNQMGQIFSRSELAAIQMNDYRSKIDSYRNMINSGHQHLFRDGDSNIITR